MNVANRAAALAAQVLVRVAGIWIVALGAAFGRDLEFLTGLMEQHEKMAWMPRAFLE